MSSKNKKENLDEVLKVRVSKSDLCTIQKAAKDSHCKNISVYIRNVIVNNAKSDCVKKNFNNSQIQTI